MFNLIFEWNKSFLSIKKFIHALYTLNPLSSLVLFKHTQNKKHIAFNIFILYVSDKLGLVIELSFFFFFLPTRALLEFMQNNNQLY